jgi:hypothetical protein
VRLPHITTPKTVSKNITCELNFKAALVKSGVKRITQTMLIMVPKNDEAFATKIASPALPCSARGYPSMEVAADAGVPGMLRSMAD